MNRIDRLRKWEPFIHVLLWGMVLSFPYVKYLEREGGYPESFTHELNGLLFIMIPCYAIYFFGLPLRANIRSITVIFPVLFGAALLYDYTDSFFHDERFRPFQWKQLFSSIVKYLGFSLFFITLFYIKKLLREQDRFVRVTNEKKASRT